MTDGVRRFEDLLAWQLARDLARRVYVATRSEEFRRDFGLASQIQRAAVSTMANIAEGFDRNRPGEFHQFLSVAKSSCAEVRSHLYVALDVGYLDDATFSELKSRSEEASRVIQGLRAAVARRRDADSEGRALSTRRSAL